MGVMAYSPLARGLLTGKFSETSQFTSGIRVRDPEFLGRRYRRNLRIVAGLADIAAGYDKTVAQLAINWVATHPGVTTAVFGAKRPSQVTENAAAVGWLISEPDRARIERLVSEEDLEP